MHYYAFFDRDGAALDKILDEDRLRAQIAKFYLLRVRDLMI